MKKILAGLLIATLTVSAGAVTTLAAEPVYGKHYVDCNKDGVCDNCANGSTKCKKYQKKCKTSKYYKKQTTSTHCNSSHKRHHKNR